MSRLVLDTNCLLMSLHYDVLKTIPFPKVEVVSLVNFMEKIL